MKFPISLYMASTSRDPPLREGDKPIVRRGKGMSIIMIIAIMIFVESLREEGESSFLFKEEWLQEKVSLCVETI